MSRSSTRCGELEYGWPWYIMSRRRSLWPMPARASPARRAERPSVRPDAPAPADCTAARALLVSSRRPAIVVGLGLEPERPYDTLRRLAEAAGAPVITTPKAKGALPDDHPLAAGTIGLTRADPAYAILDQADCILAIGFDVVELVKPWDQRAPLIWLAPWANADPELVVRAVCAGRLRPMLEELAGAAYAPAADWGAARVAHYRAALAGQALPA